ncbi:MAG TPA: helix-hairpin-helix domain-containing protein [Polyangia bacterium]|jgi:DNA uptake protein ComE-like DNA-binding protein|nr:helix-hairpin-helix domain-containing protein [Polyangia bacterium]
MKTIVLSLLLAAASPAFAQDKPATDTKTETTTTTTKKSKRAGMLDINTATNDQLKALPGITDDQVKKIVAGRPYTGKDQLLKQNIVDKDEYAKLRPLIIAKQPKAIGGQGSSDAHTGPGPASGAASGTTAAPKK